MSGNDYLTIEKFNKTYKGYYFIAFNPSDKYGYGDFILVDLLTGQIKLTCLNKEMADLPYLSDVPQEVIDYLEDN